MYCPDGLTPCSPARWFQIMPPTESTFELATIHRLQALGNGYQHGSDTLLNGRDTVPWKVLENLGSLAEVPRFCMNEPMRRLSAT